MANGDIPDSLSEHFDAIFKILQYVLSGLIFWFIIVLRKFNREHTAIMKAMPKRSLDDGLQLVTCEECRQLRLSCQNIGMTEQHSQMLRLIKDAVILLVWHSDKIPEEEKRKITKDLV